MRILFNLALLISGIYSSTDVGHIQPLSTAPLGGIWVRELPQKYQKFHREIVQKELLTSHESDKKAVLAGEGSIPTNLAYFSLVLYLQGESSTIDTVDLLPDFSTLEYPSGGHVIPDPQKAELFPLVQTRDKIAEEKKRSKASITSKITDLSKLAGLVEKPEELMGRLNGAPKEIETRLKELSEITKKLEELTEFENRFEKESTVFSEKKHIYSDYKKQTYDPEQIIARLIDHHLLKAKVDSGTIYVCGKKLSLDKVIRIGVHLHSRLDLCPYCVMFLHDRTKNWNKHIYSITGKNMVSTFISSRQEYISSSPFLLSQSFYKGSSMRLIGSSSETYNSTLTEEMLSGYAERGIVVQFLSNVIIV